MVATLMLALSCFAQDSIAVVEDIAPSPSLQETSDLWSLEPCEKSQQSWSGERVGERLDSLVASARMLQTSQMGLMVYDLTADTLVYARDERQTLRPASTMKLITAITALDRLGADYEYKTKIASVETASARSLYVVGGMDPMIGEADLKMLADSLKALGIDTIRGNIYADRSMKDSDLYGEGWCWDDDNPMLSPLVYKRKDDMMQAFRRAIASAGIYLDGRVGERTCPKDTVTLITLSRPLTDVLKPMLKLSNNLYAESVYYQIGLTKGRPATAKKAREVEEAMLKKVGKGENIHRFADGSGLSLYNYVSADILVAFLRYAYKNDQICESLYELLPVAGVDGTLKDRMKGTEAEGNVHAKTGTLSGISSLAGYCTAPNGNTLAFAIINQGVMKGAYAKALQDKICVELCK